MPSDMRRPGAIAIDEFVAALDRQLREEVGRVDRWALPQVVHRFVRTLRAVLKPIVQSAAIVLTSFAVIVAVGAAPASMRNPAPAEQPLATPGQVQVLVDEGTQIRDNLPADEFLAVSDESAAVQEADNLDMPPMTKE
jgi:hypothetical protein